MKNAIPQTGKVLLCCHCASSVQGGSESRLLLSSQIAKDAKECVQECVSEFISFITSEASERCHQEKRKTINGEDILFAMSTLGFDMYVEPLKLYLQKFREVRVAIPYYSPGTITLLSFFSCSECILVIWCWKAASWHFMNIVVFCNMYRDVMNINIYVK